MSESSSTGFQIIEKLLSEAKATGRSKTLEGWVADCKKRLADFRKTSADTRLAAQADKIEQAYQTSAELIQAVLSGKLKTPNS